MIRSDSKVFDDRDNTDAYIVPYIGHITTFKKIKGTERVVIDDYGRRKLKYQWEVDKEAHLRKGSAIEYMYNATNMDAGGGFTGYHSNNGIGGHCGLWGSLKSRSGRKVGFMHFNMVRLVATPSDKFRTEVDIEDVNDQYDKYKKIDTCNLIADEWIVGKACELAMMIKEKKGYNKIVIPRIGSVDCGRSYKKVLEIMHDKLDDCFFMCDF